MKKNKAPSLLKYILTSILVFVLALLVSIISRMFLVGEIAFAPFSENEAGLVTSMIEGVVGAIAAGLVLYQLKIAGNVEERQNNIEEAQFILQYNQAFIQDENMSKVEQLLEQAMTGKKECWIITDENRQLFINYLVYLEGLAPLIINDVLQLEHIDDLFAYRFFLAINTEEVQKDQLFAYPEYYRGCFKLYERWKRYRKEHGREILLEENSLDKWEHFEKYTDSNILVRKAEKKDDFKKIAELVYGTDPYIYPTAFGTLKEAKKTVPCLLKKPWHMFDSENIFVASVESKVAGMAIVLSEHFLKNTDGMKDLPEGVRLPVSFKHTYENYFCDMPSYLKDCTVYIACICVNENWRGRRIGEILLKGIIREYSGQRIKLHVLSDNKHAIALYEKYGFRVIGEAKTGYSYREPAPLCYEMVYEK